jgi:DNA-binding LacI/PurR family transcriptional regulator
MSETAGRATIEDVAVAAGVSVATVSRALRGLPNVAVTTRRHVEQVAASLHYRAHPAASRLATGRTRTIAVAVPLLNGWYFSQVVAGAEAVCAEAGYELVVLGVTGVEARHRLLHPSAALGQRVDGIVIVDIALDTSDVEALERSGVAVATIGCVPTGFPSVGIDDVEVGRLATEHLIALGHHRIGLIGGAPHDPLGFDVPRLRKQGHETALDAAGITVDPSLQVPGNFSVTGGRDAMLTLLDLPEPPTAIFAMSDEMAFGALMAARERGVAVPAELSIIGVDDHDLARVVDLTTVRQPVADHGSVATRLVLSLLQGDTRPRERVVRPIELVRRGTTAPRARHMLDADRLRM